MMMVAAAIKQTSNKQHRTLRDLIISDGRIVI